MVESIFCNNIYVPIDVNVVFDINNEDLRILFSLYGLDFKIGLGCFCFCYSSDLSMT